MTQIDDLFTQIAKFVLKQTDFSYSRAQTTIRQHTEKLSQTGDIIFPTTIQPWLNIIQNPNDAKNLKHIINESEEEFVQKLIEISSNWALPIRTVEFKQFRCLLFLDRPKCISNILKTVLSDETNYGQWYHTIDKGDDAKRIYAVHLIKNTDDTSLVEYRTMLIAKVLANLLRVSGIETIAEDAIVNDYNVKNMLDVFITYARKDGAKRNKRESHLENNNNTKSTLIVCGNVTTRSGYSADDFIRLRSLDMEKMAELKHGQNKEIGVLDKCRKLGTAIVTFDLLKTKHFNVIDYEKLMSTTSTVKGSAFILYNVARLEQLLASFNQQVQRGYYPSLPDFGQIDFQLLKEEEEWQMFYVYIVGFPSMLERCVSGIDNGQIAIHSLCTFLSNVSAVFSVYYHRVKILTENLPHLMPVLFCRIYFLKALRTVLHRSLSILEIEPLDQM